ncbi:hypothetical protein BTZ53_10700 [Vibrio parahaemolyticus]|nr:hypothetical protein [Vibrio parahaemolyticus]OUJ46523.1 hypothetical protein BTZ53_10700 [Vibrio parahaemolyticus]
MPTVYFSADESWIDQQLSKVANTTRAKICVLYAEAYEAFITDKTIPSVKRQNCARQGANTRLRLYVEKYAKYLRGDVSKPEIAKGGARK